MSHYNISFICIHLLLNKINATMCILFFFLSFFLSRSARVSFSSFAEHRHSLGFVGSFNVAIVYAYVMTSKVNAPNGISACVQSSQILPITSMHTIIIHLLHLHSAFADVCPEIELNF